MIDDVPTYRRNIGLVFQDEQLFPHRTVTENIEFGLRSRRGQHHLLAQAKYALDDLPAARRYFEEAVRLFRELSLSPTFEEFLTLPAYKLLAA